jgi:hypothetical protein
VTAYFHTNKMIELYNPFNSAYRSKKNKTPRGKTYSRMAAIEYIAHKDKVNALGIDYVLVVDDRAQKSPN